VIEGGNNKKQEPAYGADVLRLWISSVDYSGDVCVGANILKQVRKCSLHHSRIHAHNPRRLGPAYRQVSDSYRKLRNTARYLIGNLHDFEPATHAVPYERLPRLDKYMLGRLSSLLKEVEEAYEQFQFNRASQALQVRLCALGMMPTPA
jgi:isoleucyl-tRNA synthetase